jgi:hypothetical protein
VKQGCSDESDSHYSGGAGYFPHIERNGDIFHQGEAERSDDHVNHGVNGLIEKPAFSDYEPGREKLKNFFSQSEKEKRQWVGVLKREKIDGFLKIYLKKDGGESYRRSGDKRLDYHFFRLGVDVFHQEEKKPRQRGDKSE